MYTRREVVKQGVALVTLGATVPGIFHKAALASALDGVTAASEPGRALVIVQLAGGNDGLNTVVPYADGAYRSARRALAVAADRVLPLDDRAGLHAALAPLKPLWDARKLAVVEGVGYPNPNLSHFASMHIWQTASPDGKGLGGWIGRYLDELERREHDPLYGFNVGNGLAPEMRGRIASPPAVANVAEYRPQFSGDPRDGDARKGTLLKLYEAYPRPAPYAALLERTLDDLLTTSAAVQAADAAYQPAVQYPETSFGSGLQLLAQVITSQAGFRVGHITLGGFDTHSRQQDDHERLLGTLAGGLAAFWQDLEAHGVADRVLVMTWSEFGRRVAENASGGTDHGAAGPLFVLGAGVRGGFYGAPPPLTQLEQGNLRYTTDFRSVYATVLERWLGADPGLLGGRFPLLGFV